MSGVEGAAVEPAELLAGLRVVEIGCGIAGPLVGMLLAEQGAEVVRVVSGPEPNPDPLLDAILGRGKLEAEVAWHHPEGRAILEILVANADIVIECPPALGGRRPDLDYERIRAETNPGLIDCLITPFPEYDPRAALPGHEAIAGAAGCLYSKPLGRPQYHDFSIGSVSSALYAANGVLAALIARLKLGRGQRVESNLYQCNMVAQVLQIFMQAGVPRGFLPLKMVGSPAMRCWECKDGRYVYLHITMPAHNVRILELLESGGFAAQARRLRSVMSPETMRDPSQVKSIPEAKRIKAIYEEVFVEQTADEWEALIGQELCCIKVRTVEEWLEDSLAAGMSDACRLDDSVFGELLAPGALVTSPEIQNTITPMVREAERFSELRERWTAEPSPLATAPAAPEVGQPEAPLAGVRVMDFSRIIAGPCAARVLAELGAEVISLQSPTNLDWALSFHLIFNAGKKSVTLDFKDEAGKEKLWAVLEDFQPDAFIQNYRNLDVARAVGVDPESMRRHFPKIAYTHLNAYGNHGVWKDRPGFEQVVQAVSGIQVAYARGGRPKLLPSPIIDIGCGLLGAFGTLLGLFHQRRTGAGLVATTHLTSVSVLLQLPQIVAMQRQRALAQAKTRGATVTWDPDGEVVAGVLSALTGSVCLAGPRRDLRRWLAHQGWAGNGHALEGRELEAAAEHFSSWSLRRWTRSLEEAGVSERVALLPYPRIRRLVGELPRVDPRPRPFLRRRPYPGCEQPLAFLRLPLNLSVSPLPEIDPPALRGGDSEEILGRIGEAVAREAGAVPYPPNKPLLVWLGSVIRWGYFAWKSGNI